MAKLLTNLSEELTELIEKKGKEKEIIFILEERFILIVLNVLTILLVNDSLVKTFRLISALSFGVKYFINRVQLKFIFNYCLLALTAAVCASVPLS